MEQNTIGFVSSVAASSVPLLAAVISVILPNLFGRKIKAQLQEIELEAKNYERYEKGLSVAKKFDSDFAVKIDISHLRHEFNELLSERLMQQKSSLLLLETYLSQSKFRLLKNLSLPEIRFPREEAAALRYANRASAVFMSLGALLIISYPAATEWFQKTSAILDLPKNIAPFLGFELMLFAVIYNFFSRSTVKQARDKLRVIVERAENSAADQQVDPSTT